MNELWRWLWRSKNEMIKLIEPLCKTRFSGARWSKNEMIKLIE
ncbi:hypothetical protein [Helicobacter sp. MIT 14-3879]|nr:hypothetical protein [Helicobacter sp. MIT 14-3879]